MLRRKRIASVVMIVCGFVFAGGWMVLSATKGSSQDPAGPYYTEWSAPEPVTELNTSLHEYPDSISRDGLSLYLTRLNSGTKEDIYVVHRPDTESNWGAPIRLPDGINTSATDRSSFVSSDGHWLYFTSDRPGGMGGVDLYVSWRAHVHDDFAWQTPVNIVEVNTSANEGSPALFEDEESGLTQLYFGKDISGALASDIYMSVLGPGGFEPPTPVVELNSPTPYFDGRPYLRRDGREIYFTSNRPGSLGRTDVWVSTRSSIDDPWSLPENVSVLNNAKQNQFTPLSWDGKTMYLAIGEPSANDIYVTHREKVKGKK